MYEAKTLHAATRPLVLGNWCHRFAGDVDAVESKLKRIGVQSIPELLIELKANSLNESLRSKGEKRFCQSTLLALKKCCSTWCGSRERKRRKEPQNKVAQVSEMPSGSDLGPKGLSPGLSTLECPAARPLEELSDTELWTEYMSEGIAPPSFSRDNLIRMLEVVRSWRTASPMELSQLCWSFGLAASAEESQDVLCQRLKNQTWEAWQIPIQRFLGNGNMAEAYELLEHFQELELMSADELLVLCHKKGLPIEQSLDAVVMKERLKLVAFWEQLPLAELEMELCRRGLPCPNIPFPGVVGFESVRGWPPRGELLRILLQAMHNEALAQFLRQEQMGDLGEESCADDELTSGIDEEDGPFFCLECGCWAHPDGEAAWVEDHKCCDECAWRIYHEERAKAAVLADGDDLEEAEVNEWIQRWRERWHASKSNEPAPEPSCSEEIYAEFATSVFPVTESEGEEILCRFERRRAEGHGLKAYDRSEPEDDWRSAWNVIAELPTDASEGEESPRAYGPEHWNFLQLSRQEPAPAEKLHRAAPASEPSCCAQAPSLAPEKVEQQGRVSQMSQSSSLHTCFCYASPLAKGLRELNVRAEWEALASADGLSVEVRSATSEALQEVLLSKSRPEIVHLAAHCAAEGEGSSERSVVLEGTDGSPHLLPAEHLAELGWWDGIQLLVFLACSSQSLVQRLIESRGLRRAVCCSAVVLDAASQMFCRTFYRALGAGQALNASFEAAQAAIRYGTNKAFHAEAGKFVLLCSDGWGWPAREVPSLPLTLWPTWPRVEDYVGREAFTVSLATLFEHRRAVCLWGEKGSGKTALCLEFCRFFSAPGRRFSQGAFHVNARQVLCAAALEALLRQRLTSKGAVSLLEAVRLMDELGRPWLLIVDGLSPAVLEAEETNGLLSWLLEETTSLRLLLTARGPLYGPSRLGYSKVVDLPLPHLDPTEASLLLARRARRPFFPCDFGAAAAGAAAGAPLRLGPELLRQLNESPMMRALKGHPGHIVTAAAAVDAELQSLLRHPLIIKASNPSLPVEPLNL